MGTRKVAIMRRSRIIEVSRCPHQAILNGQGTCVKTNVQTPPLGRQHSLLLTVVLRMTTANRRAGSGDGPTATIGRGPGRAGP